MGLGVALVVGEAADEGGGFRDDAGQVQGLVDAAPLGGGLVHDAVDEQGLGEAAGVGCGFDHDDNQVQVFHEGAHDGSVHEVVGDHGLVEAAVGGGVEHEGDRVQVLHDGAEVLGGLGLGGEHVNGEQVLVEGQDGGDLSLDEVQMEGGL